jgi:uncharacterized repeat protein (TIGR02543 family)
MSGYTVTFHTNGGGEIQPQTVQSGGKATIPAPPTKEGYTLDGWYTATDYATKWDFETHTVTTDIDLYAKWLDSAIIYRTVTFHTNGGTPADFTRTAADGDKITLPSPAPTLEGHTFDGWYTATDYATKWDFDTHTVTTNIDLYAKWLDSAIIYRTVTFHTNGGTPADFTQTAADGGKATQPAAPVRTGYTFDGWFTDAAGTGAAWDFDKGTVKENITLYAKWTRNTYKVTFDTGNVEPTPVLLPAVPYDDKITDPGVTKTGYTFDGWYKEAAKTTKWNFATDTVSKNITLYGTWTRNTYTVTFNTGNVEPTPETRPAVPYDDKIADPGVTKTSYTFDGWYKEAAKTTKWNFATDTVTKNITLYGTWIKNPIVTFNTGEGGSIVPALEVPYGGAATKPATNPTRAGGWTFDGWYKEAACTNPWNFGTDTVTKNITLYAKWAVWLLSNELGISREYTSYADETHYTYKYSYGAGEYEISRDGVHEHTVRIYTYDNGDVDTSIVDYVYDTDSGIIKQESVTKTQTRSGVTSSPSETVYLYTVNHQTTDSDGKKTYNQTYITDNYGSVKYELYTIKDGVTLSRLRYGANATLHSTLTYTFPDIPVIRERLPKLTLCSTVYSSWLSLSNTHETCELLESTDTTLSFRIDQFYSPNSLRSQSYYTYTKRTLS